MAMDGDRWLSAKAAERRARTTYRYRTDAAALRDAWRTAARQSGWTEEDWWIPAVDTLTRAIVQGRAIEPACAQLGRERAEAGLGIRETLDDLYTVYGQLPAGAPPPHAVWALVEAWTLGRTSGEA